MMKAHTRTRKIVVLMGLCLVAGLGAQAAWYSRVPFLSKWFSKGDRVEALLVTGNYAQSRLLAELVQYKTKQPIILISPRRGGGNDVFFLPSGPEAMVLEPERYQEFIAFLQPKRVVVLGDDSFVPPRFLELVRDHPTVVVKSRDWRKNAETLAEMFDYSKLPEYYVQYLGQLGTAALQNAGAVEEATAPEPFVLPTGVVPLE